MVSSSASPLVDLSNIEWRLRSLLPADLYATAWIDPSHATLMKVFEHLRTLQRILIDYVPRDVSDVLPQPGKSRYSWQSGSLLFTDLAGFTPLLEASATEGRAGAEALIAVLNRYFAQMLEIISKSGGNLLEFTGDALLVQFTSEHYQGDAERAIHAGLRMQRAMKDFAHIPTAQGELSLKMRIGIHDSQFVAADIGTPMRMSHVLLGQAVQVAKRAEGVGTVGRVSVTAPTCDRIPNRFRWEPGSPNHALVIDDLTSELGEYDIAPNRRRSATPMLFDRSPAGLLAEITSTLQLIEPLASYLPRSVLQVLVDNVSQRRIPPAFPTIAVAFVSLIGLPEAVDETSPEETDSIVACFSKAFSLINGAIELRGGILQKVTYHSLGSDMLIHFGVLKPDPSDPVQAAEAMLAIRDLVASIPGPSVRGQTIRLTCRIGLTYGAVFASEFGEPRGRREFNVLGDPVNTASRLMNHAMDNQILLGEPMAKVISPHFNCQPLGHIALKGKSNAQPIYTLESRNSACNSAITGRRK